MHWPIRAGVGHQIDFPVVLPVRIERVDVRTDTWLGTTLDSKGNLGGPTEKLISQAVCLVGARRRVAGAKHWNTIIFSEIPCEWHGDSAIRDTCRTCGDVPVGDEGDKAS